jgi:hypothetical protein
MMEPYRDLNGAANLQKIFEIKTKEHVCTERSPQPNCSRFPTMTLTIRTIQLPVSHKGDRRSVYYLSLFQISDFPRNLLFRDLWSDHRLCLPSNHFSPGL